MQDKIFELARKLEAIENDNLQKKCNFKGMILLYIDLKKLTPGKLANNGSFRYVNLSKKFTPKSKIEFPC